MRQSMVARLGRLCLPVAVVCLLSLWALMLLTSSHLAVDFYPLYFAAERVLAGLSPYGSEATLALMERWDAPFGAAGVGYPMQFVLTVVPLAVLPYALAAAVWTGFGALAVYGGFLYSSAGSPHDPYKWLVPLAYFPLYRNLVLGQATLLWVGLALVMLAAIKHRRPWLVSVCVALLVLKPQTGIIFALYGAYWLWGERRGALWLSAGVLGGLTGLTLLLQPAWVTAWLAQVSTYRSVVDPPSLLPWALLALAAMWRSHLWARLAVVQVIAFPLSDLYSALPLLIAWAMLPVPLALAGAGVSWSWQLFGLPNTTAPFWALLLIPVVAASAWHAWGQRTAPAASHGAGQIQEP